MGDEKAIEKMASNGSSAGGSAGVSADDENSVLKAHSIDYLSAFSKLGIKPPNRLSEVRAALDAVVSKAAFYETTPAPTEEEKAKRSDSNSNKASKKSSKNAANSDVDLMNGAFPGLGSENGSGTRGGLSVADKPSFKAVASGDAAAPIAPPMSVSAPALGTTGDVDPVVGGDENQSDHADIDHDEVNGDGDANINTDDKTEKKDGDENESDAKDNAGDETEA